LNMTIKNLTQAQAEDLADAFNGPASEAKELLRKQMALDSLANAKWEKMNEEEQGSAKNVAKMEEEEIFR